MPPTFSTKSYLKVALLIGTTLLFAACKEFCGGTSIETQEIVIPTTTFIPEPINSYTPRRIADLSKIVIALEKYKRENHSYPISSAGWDGIYSEYGESKSDWIAGLAPKYLDSLPHDLGADPQSTTQYLYRSDGANYKLISNGPDDCEEIKLTSPQLVDPERDCRAYGFWTERAVAW